MLVQAYPFFSFEEINFIYVDSNQKILLYRRSKHSTYLDRYNITLLNQQQINSTNLLIITIYRIFHLKLQSQCRFRQNRKSSNNHITNFVSSVCLNNLWYEACFPYLFKQPRIPYCSPYQLTLYVYDQTCSKVLQSQECLM